MTDQPQVPIMLINSLRNRHGSQPEPALRICRALLNFARLPDLRAGLLAAGCSDALLVGCGAGVPCWCLPCHVPDCVRGRKGVMRVVAAAAPWQVSWSRSGPVKPPATTLHPSCAQMYATSEDARIADAARGTLLQLGELPELSAKVALQVRVSCCQAVPGRPAAWFKSFCTLLVVRSQSL